MAGSRCSRARARVQSTGSRHMSFASYPSLKSAVVFVTGGASGIGEDIVRAFAAQGSRVGFVDIDARARRRARRRIWRRRAPTVRFEPCDLRDIDALKRAFAALEAALGPAAVLVNNAARDDRHAWQDVTPEYLRRADRRQPAAHVLRHPGRRARHDRRRQGLDHQLRLELLVAGVRRHAGLHLPPRRPCTA